MHWFNWRRPHQKETVAFSVSGWGTGFSQRPIWGWSSSSEFPHGQRRLITVGCSTLCQNAPAVAVIKSPSPAPHFDTQVQELELSALAPCDMCWWSRVCLYIGLELELEKCLLDKKQIQTGNNVTNDTYTMFYVGRPLQRRGAHRWSKRHRNILQYMNRHRAHEVLTFGRINLGYATKTKAPHWAKLLLDIRGAHSWHSYNEGKNKTVVSKAASL